MDSMRTIAGALRPRKRRLTGGSSAPDRPDDAPPPQPCQPQSRQPPGPAVWDSDGEEPIAGPDGPDGLDGPTAVASLQEPGADGRGRLLSYVQRLPTHMSGDADPLKRVSSVPGNLSLFRAHLTDPLLRPEFRAAPRYTRYQPVRVPAGAPDNTPAYGYALLALTSVLFVSSMYSLVVAKFMPYTGVPFLDAVKDDRYFCLLMPVTGLSFGFAVFWNWLGMKYFRHNC
ncbi:hypothetical protein H4R18_003711 [Coemansia javaensis]|uniref:Uncharacterized protein n=1 Tax=Coemansia javaensis TaxID=2761396 RepID=A0A9W8LFW5_9FUNG|nr:hypothetical protein H4R18_003711 [Coemansia javaensis]